MQIAILIVSSASLVVSCTTLALVLGSATKAINEVENVKTRTNESLNKVQEAVEALKF